MKEDKKMDKIEFINEVHTTVASTEDSERRREAALRILEFHCKKFEIEFPKDENDFKNISTLLGSMLMIGGITPITIAF